MNRLGRSGLGALRVLTLLLGALGMALVLRLLPPLKGPLRRRCVRAWSRLQLGALGVRVRVQGQPKSGVKLVVANHISFLDIAVLHDQCPEARFVAKAEVRHWPLVGWLASRAGTLFIERSHRRDALRVVHDMAAGLQAGDTVAVFPEGTVGPPLQPLPFHGNLLQAAIATDQPVQAVSLQYRRHHGQDRAALNEQGDVTLWQALWHIATQTDLEAHVVWQSPQRCAHLERRALAQGLHASITAHLQEP